MATILLDANGAVVMHYTALLDPMKGNLPAHAGEFEFDHETNPILVTALNNEPQRVTVKAGKVLLDGQPLALNAERQDNADRRNIMAVRDKVKAGTALTPADIQLAIRYLLARVGS